MKKLLFIALVMNLSSCSHILFERTHLFEMETETDGAFVAERDFPQVQGDTGQAYRSREEIQKRTPASARISKNQRLENTLTSELEYRLAKISDAERRDFYRDTRFLTNNSEKIYYLSLSPWQRRDYIQNKVNESRTQEFDHLRGMGQNSLSAYYESPLSVGMSKDQVVYSWGRPMKVEVAGNPRNQNERWSFYRNGRVQYIYFEGGIIKGWTLQ